MGGGVGVLGVDGLPTETLMSGAPEEDPDPPTDTFTSGPEDEPPPSEMPISDGRCGATSVRDALATGVPAGAGASAELKAMPSSTVPRPSDGMLANLVRPGAIVAQRVPSGVAPAAGHPGSGDVRKMDGWRMLAAPFGIQGVRRLSVSAPSPSATTVTPTVIATSRAIGPPSAGGCVARSRASKA